MIRPLGSRYRLCVLLGLLVHGTAAAFVLLSPAGRRSSVLFGSTDALSWHPASAGARSRRAHRQNGETVTALHSASSPAAAARTSVQLVATCGVVAALFLSSPAVAKGGGHGGGHGGGGHGHSGHVQIREALKWEQVDAVEVCISSSWWAPYPRPPPSCSQRPAHGKEFKNEYLASKLQQQLEFTKEEWDQLKVPTLYADSYIKVGDKYFKPAWHDPISAIAAWTVGLFVIMRVISDWLDANRTGGLRSVSNQSLREALHSSTERSQLEDERRLWVATPPLLSGRVGTQRTGTYSATYTERGTLFTSTYDLRFHSDGRVTGKGSDPDGALCFTMCCVCARA